MEKNNFWNRIFKPKKIKENQAEYKKLKSLIGHADELDALVQAAGSFEDLIDAHKKVYAAGFTKNLGPEEFGMFRTKDISSMKPEEVFLGGIYGLHTKNIPFWEKHSTELFGAGGWEIDPKTPLFCIVFKQYQLHLIRNIFLITVEASKKIKQYEICGYR